jgi:hypothetical protein
VGPLKYSNNKMGINDVINKLSINYTRANLLHKKLIKRKLNFNEWMHKLKKFLFLVTTVILNGGRGCLTQF